MDLLTNDPVVTKNVTIPFEEYKELLETKIRLEYEEAKEEEYFNEMEKMAIEIKDLKDQLSKVVDKVVYKSAN